MSKEFVAPIAFHEFALWDKLKHARSVVAFDLEITARCNNACRHCYINLPPDDKEAIKRELTFKEIKSITDQAVELGAFWCLITGGEPFLRKDFSEIYLYLKKKGLLISVFTNAVLINEEHVKFFKRYPPRDIEVSVYGTTRQTYESVTGINGSFLGFTRGLKLLLKAGIKVRFKAMALRSNVHQLPEISAFCRKHTKDYFRFDPFLHLRFDGNAKRNAQIKSERLSSAEVVSIEQADSERFSALENGCDKLIIPELAHTHCNHLFHCGAGNGSFTVSYDGFFRLCSSLSHPDCIYDLKKGSLKEAWTEFVPRVRDLRSNKEVFLKKCRSCSIINLCIWCPAHSYLETKEMDTPVDYFCEVAHAREKSLVKK